MTLHALQPRAKSALPQGFSLVELMVALVLGAVVTLGIITMFARSQESNAVVQGQARIQDNARYSIDFVTRSLRMAGFVGCVSRNDALRSALNGGFTNLPYIAAINTMIQGYEGGEPAAASWTPALSTLPTVGAGAIDVAVIAPGTDVLVVRQVSDEARLAVVQASSNSPLTVVAPADVTRYASGTFAVVSDCTKASLFQVSASAAAAGNLVVQHQTGGGNVPGNAVATLPGFNEDSAVYSNEASLFRVQTTIYFVAPSAGTNNRGQTPMSLWRKIDDAAPVELIDGIEDMEVRFGIDTDTDGVPNQYVNANGVTDPNRVVTVRVRFTANSVDVVPGAGNNTTISRVFESTVAVRNRLT